MFCCHCRPNARDPSLLDVYWLRPKQLQDANTSQGRLKARWTRWTKKEGGEDGAWWTPIPRDTIVVSALSPSRLDVFSSCLLVESKMEAFMNDVIDSLR